MELIFGEADLAELCNSKRLMVERWGHEGFSSVGRRLVQLAAAADLSDVEALPGAALDHGPGGAVTIDFASGETIIRAVLLDGSAQRSTSSATKYQCLQVRSVEVRTAQAIS